LTNKVETGDLAGSNNVAAVALVTTNAMQAGDLAGSNYTATVALGLTNKVEAGDLAGSNNVALVAIVATNAQAVATQHVARVDNPHAVTAAQVGALTNNQAGVSFSGPLLVTNLVVDGVQTNLGTVNLAGNVQYGGTNAALWCITTTNAYLDIGTNRIYLTP
jgi:hypothetical protein